MLDAVIILVVVVQLYFWDDVFSAFPERLREWFLFLAVLVFFVFGIFDFQEPADTASNLLVGFYSGLSGMHYYTKWKNGAQ